MASPQSKPTPELTEETRPSSPKDVLAAARHRLSIDLSSVPPLIEPSPPSNTLLITNLLDPTIFHPASLSTIRQSINSIAALHSFSPIRSLRRIICSFYQIEDATAVRVKLDGQAFMGVPVKIYFGEPTPIDEDKDHHLAAPESSKLFFISPPPSPPHGWEMRNEEPPNKEVHAEDLLAALNNLSTKTRMPDQQSRPANEYYDFQDTATEPNLPLSPSLARSRSKSTTVVYQPEDHGPDSPLPAVMVEDTTGDDVTEEAKPIKAHTARPPTELMD